MKMIVIYIIVAYLNALLRYVQVPVLSVIMSVFGVTLLKLIPIVMMGLWILRTTYMDDLLVALQRMRLPQAVPIPLVAMFRYIPTLRIEYRQIRSTMNIRGISDTLWKRVSHPLATIEYILIPLLMRCLKVTDELAAPGTTRGLELECKRYALRPIRFSWPEILVSLLGVLFLPALLSPPLESTKQSSFLPFPKISWQNRNHSVSNGVAAMFIIQKKEPVNHCCLFMIWTPVHPDMSGNSLFLF